MADVARALMQARGQLAAGAAAGAGAGVFGGLRGIAPMPQAIATGALSGLAVPMANALSHNNPNVAGIVNALMLGPAGAPGMIGNALELMGVAKPAPQNIRLSKDYDE